MRVCAENGTKHGLVVGQLARRECRYFSFASTTIDRPSGVSSASDDSCAASASVCFGHAGRRQELGRLPVAERDRAGLVEQQRVDVAGRFDGAAGHRQHVVLHQPIHAGDADRRDQRADRRRNQADEQRDQHGNRDLGAGVVRERLQRHDDQQEDQRQHREQDVQRDLVRRLLPLGAFDQRDHPIEEGLAGIRRDAHDDPVRQHARAAGDRRRSPPASRITGADSPVIADSSTLATPSMISPSPGINSPASTRTMSPARKALRRHGFLACRRGRAIAVVSVLALRSVSACALPRPSAIASAKLAKSTVNQSQNATCPVNSGWPRAAQSAPG